VRQEDDVQTWQWLLLVVFVVLPLALMSDFWPGSERLTSRGVPIPREWIRQIRHDPVEDDHH
jgi:hypothetical protein